MGLGSVWIIEFKKRKLNVDLNINTSGEIQLLELVHGAGCGINNVEEALV